MPSDWAGELDRLGLERITPAPGGDWVQLRKLWPAEIDQWTHYLHGADGNPVARDRVVGPPKHYQWISGPMWQRSHETDSSISTLVTAAGRLFYIEDQAPISLVGDHSLPDKWFLVARDAFNGVELWKVPIRRWGWREWKETWFTNRPGDFPLNLQKRLVAAGDQRVRDAGLPCAGVSVGCRHRRDSADLRGNRKNERNPGRGRDPDSVGPDRRRRPRRGRGRRQRASSGGRRRTFTAAPPSIT